MRTLLLCSFVALIACKKPAAPEPAAAPASVSAAAAASAQNQADAVQQVANNFSRVFFDYNAANLNSQSRQALEENAELLKQYSGIKTEIQGHCDERGTTDYNIALGSRRAMTVKDYLVSKGVSPSRITTISYGEERPLQSGETEVAWSKNRRAEFRVTADGGTDVSGSTN